MQIAPIQNMNKVRSEEIDFFLQWFVNVIGVETNHVKPWTLYDKLRKQKF